MIGSQYQRPGLVPASRVVSVRVVGKVLVLVGVSSTLWLAVAFSVMHFVAGR